MIQESKLIYPGLVEEVLTAGHTVYDFFLSARAEMNRILQSDWSVRERAEFSSVNKCSLRDEKGFMRLINFYARLHKFIVFSSLKNCFRNSSREHSVVCQGSFPFRECE